MSFEDLREHFAAKDDFPEHAEWISHHLDRYFEETEMRVFHEIASLDFHLDVYLIQPKSQKFNILLTSGMSTIAMELDEGIPDADERRFAEVMMIIPKDLKFSDAVLGDKENDWVISMLKSVARFPHHEDTWLGIGHTIQATADMEPYDERTDYIGGILLPSVTMPEEFVEIRRDGRVINFFSFFPLYENELRHKIEIQYSAFLDILIEKNIPEGFDLDRENLLD